MSDRLETKMDEVLEKLGKFEAHIENTHKRLDEIHENLIPNGRTRMTDIEKEVKANTRVRHILVFVTGVIGTVIGWIVSVLPGGSH